MNHIIHIDAQLFKEVAVYNRFKLYLKTMAELNNKYPRAIVMMDEDHYMDLVKSSNGVQFNAPPSLEMQNAIRSSVQTYLDDVDRKHVKGGLFTVATRTPDGQLLINAVVVVKPNDNVEIAGWIGKTWGSELTGGVEGRIYW